MDIDLVLSQVDGRPMYLQIIEQIKKRIALGEWPPGEKLPSIRELAVAIRVSVITVKRAYQELEAQGIIYTQQGKGSFVSLDSSLEQKMRETDMTEHLTRVLILAESLGWTIQDISVRLEQVQNQKMLKNQSQKVQEEGHHD